MEKDLFSPYPCTVLVRLGAFWGAFCFQKYPSTLIPAAISHPFLWLPSQARVASQEIAACQAEAVMSQLHQQVKPHRLHQCPKFTGICLKYLIFIIVFILRAASFIFNF